VYKRQVHGGGVLGLTFVCHGGKLPIDHSWSAQDLVIR